MLETTRKATEVSDTGSATGSEGPRGRRAEGEGATAMILPNFIIVGAAKAGTTSLHDYLRQHPEIFMPALKEPKFFSYEEGRQGNFPVRTLEAYAALFAGATEPARGEASPHYLTSGFAARKIRDTIPEARIIISLRNPVERSYSIYLMNLRNRGFGEGRSFAEALDDDINITRKYHACVARYIEFFGAEQVKVILFDDLVRDARATVAGLFRFLRVRDDFVPDLSQAANPGGLPKVKILHGILNNGHLRAAARSLLPETVIDRGRQVRSRNLQKQKMTPEDRARALTVFRDDILRTQDLIGRDLTDWLRG
jgi:hypothetical protein